MAGSKRLSDSIEVARARRIPAIALLMPLLLSVFAPGCFQIGDTESGTPPEDIWSEDYANQIFPWAPADNDQLQFRAYHDYFSMRDRMQFLADRNSDIFQFHEGLLGGVNARGDDMAATDYEG